MCCNMTVSRSDSLLKFCDVVRERASSRARAIRVYGAVLFSRTGLHERSSSNFCDVAVGSQ